MLHTFSSPSRPTLIVSEQGSVAIFYEHWLATGSLLYKKKKENKYLMPVVSKANMKVRKKLEHLVGSG